MQTAGTRGAAQPSPRMPSESPASSVSGGWKLPHFHLRRRNNPGEGPTSERRRRAQPPVRSQAGGERGGCGHAADGPPDAATAGALFPSPDLRPEGARADDPATTERGRKLHAPEAAKLPGRVGKSGNPHLPPARPLELAKSGVL